MEREVRQFKVDYDLDWLYEVKISKLREDLDAIEKLGATHVIIESGASYDCPYTTIEAVSEHLETDEEFSIRVKEIEQIQSEIKRKELEQFSQLKMKYGL